MLNHHYELNDLNTPLIKEFCDRMPGGYFIYKADGNEELIYANQDVFEIFGCKNEEEFRELTGYTFKGMVYPNDYPEVSDSIVRQICESEKKRDYVEYRIRRKDGTVVWVNDYGHYVDSPVGGLYYVFISDVTKKRRVREEEVRERETIIETLTRFYHTVWVITDVETEQWSLYYADDGDGTVPPKTIEKKFHRGSYSEDRVALVNTMVAEEDRERINRELSISGIKEQLRDKDQFSLTFLRQYSDGTPSRYFRVDTGKLKAPGGSMGVTMGFKDIDKEYRAVVGAQQAILEAEKTKKENELLYERFEAVKGLADLVDSVTAILSNIPAMTFSKSADGIYIACNQAFADYAHKASPEELIGHTDFDLFEAKKAQKIIDDDMIAMSMDKPHVFFEDVLTGDGKQKRNLQTTKVKFIDSKGRPCLMGICVDVTEITRIKTIEAVTKAHQQELEERLILQDQLLEEELVREAQDRIITALASDYRSVYWVDLDADDAVCYRSDPTAVNQHAENVHFSYHESFVGYATIYINENYRDGFLRFIDPDNIRKELAQNITISYRYLIKREGREYYEMISFAKIKNDETGGDDSVHTVVLGLTVVDAEMRDSIAKNEALGRALTQAEDASKAKTAFLSNMSHEIRTPMNAIIGLANLALKDRNVSPKTRSFLENINDSAHHLLSLINDILDMSRIESGRLILRSEEFSFRTMLEQINTIAMSQCNDKGLRYECRVIGAVSDYYIGDDVKLKQVLINILGNAVKFTEAPGDVIMTVERVNVFSDQSTMKFVIKDTGIGISEEFIPKIFESFTQENGSKKSRYGSTGLGMAITKNIIELMNGTISVQSEKGSGSEFTVIVTLRNCDHSDSAAGYISPRDMRVLVVDSDKASAEHARLMLGDAGVHTDACYSGKDALRMLRLQYIKHNPYNLVLIDMMLQSKDGVETVKKIRKVYDKETTVVILTSVNPEGIKDEIKKCGADGFLTKPMAASQVIDEFRHIARKNEIGLITERSRIDLAGKRILLAEDVIINAEIIKQLMLMKDAQIDHAENGRIAVDMFAESKPGYYDAILMDVRMPEMDGLEATEVIRAMSRPDAKRVPIIAMTANAFDEDVQRSLQAGMNAHLSKPVEPEHLYSVLEELIWEAENAEQ